MEKRKITISPKGLEMKQETFIELFEKLLEGGELKYQTYRKVERIHERIFGCSRYSCYDSFRKIRSRKVGQCPKPEKPAYVNQ